MFTEGSFTNAVALFPQVDWRPARWILLRGGVLVAWGAARVVDPVATLLGEDGEEIEDDLVNFHGGPPARFYGTELDGRVTLFYEERFFFDLEGALLLPGAALRDENGDAAAGGLVEAALTFAFPAGAARR